MFHERLQEARLPRTQEEVARAVTERGERVSACLLGHYERGRRIPDERRTVALALALGTSVDELLALRRVALAARERA
jgi:transcriptional regulator with XRE-family HTH domain